MSLPEMVIALDDNQMMQFIQLGIDTSRVRQTRKNGSITLYVRKLTRAEKDAQQVANPRKLEGRDKSWPTTSRS